MRWILAIAVSIVSASFAQDAFDTWERRMLDGAYSVAADFAEGFATREASSAVWSYRAAASHAMANAPERAIDWLRTAAERGYSGVRTIETDSDLDPIRANAEFEVVANMVRSNARRRMASFRDAAERAEPTVVLPRRHDAATPAPLVIVLHGTGGSGRAAARAWRGATQRVGAILVAADALRPSGDGYAWVFRDESEWYIEHLIEEAKRAHAVGPVIVAGFSQGASIALAMGRSHPDLFDGVIAVCGHWEDDVAAIPAEGERPAWFLMIGERDPWVETYAGGEAALSGAGMDVEVRVVPRLGHQMPPSRDLHAALAWCLERAGRD